MAAELLQKCIITNGDPSLETIKAYEDSGYILLSTQNANRFHPYVLDTDMISFFAKPIDKAKYDADMKLFRAQQAVNAGNGNLPKAIVATE